MPTAFTTLTIRGMNAVHAIRAVETALGGLEGVVRAEVTLGEAVVEHDPTLSAEAMQAAVSVAGFEVERAVRARGHLPLL